jgi:hypothetical protein
MSRNVSLIVAVCAAFLFVPSKTSNAQPLAKQVRSDALIYLGWTGTTSMGPSYEGSHLRAIVDASNFDEVFDRFLPSVMDRIAQQAGAQQFEPVRQMLRDVGAPLVRHPSAIYFGGVTFANGDKPVPHAAVLCQAGKDATAMLARLQNVATQVPKDAAPIRAARVGGDVVVFSIGFERAEMAVAGAGKSLSDDAGYRSAMANVHKDALLALYVNVGGILEQADAAVEKSGDAKVKEQVRKALGASGLTGLRRVIMTEAFEGKDWGSRAFVDAPAPRKGLLTLLDGAPLTDESLAVIPQSATVAGAGRFDLSKLVATIRTGITEFDPEAGQKVDQGLAMVRDQTGLDVERDILAPLGDEWTYYIDPLGGGKSVAGFTIVNRLKDAAKADESMARVQLLVNQIAQQQLKSTPVRIAIKETDVNGLKIRYLALPLVTPAWAIADGNLYFGFYPQTVSVAAEHVRSKSPSILQNESFLAARKAMAGKGAVSGIQFMDLPRTAPDAYPGWVMLSRLVGIGDLFGVDSPAVVGPPLKTLLAHLSPTMTVSWSDEKGSYAHTRQPFPGSSLLASDPLGGNPFAGLQAFPAFVEMMKDARRMH